MASWTILIGVSLIVATAVYRYLIYPIYVSPLSNIPIAHWSSGFSSLWLLWQKWIERENRAVYDRHIALGPVVRLAPNILSVNCFEDGVKRIYQGGFPKSDFYADAFTIYGVENIFTIKDNETHTTRKKGISSTFTKSAILSSSTALNAVHDVLYNQYLPILHRAASTSTPIEVLNIHFAYGMDTFTQWQFGHSLCSSFLTNHSDRDMYLNGWFALAPYTIWQSLPSLSSLLSKLGISTIPARALQAFSALETWNLEKCDRAQALLDSYPSLALADQPVIFEQASRALNDINTKSKPSTTSQRMNIAAEMFTHNSAAFETAGNTLTYLFYELSRHPPWQDRLRSELQTLHPSAQYQYRNDTAVDADIDINTVPNSKDIDALPILHAVLVETLRLWPSVPGAQPRVVPAPCEIAGHKNIPTGTIVQSYAYSLHLSPEVFPDPMVWKPERWLDATPAEKAEMRKWFWAFGSGGRMCLGSHFAYLAMKALIAAVYSTFTTEIHDHGDMELVDAYIAGPKGRRLEIMFKRA